MQINANNEDAQEISKKTIISVLSSFLIYGFSFLTAPIFANLLSQREYGITTIYFSWATIFGMFITLQLNGSINNSIVEYPKEENAYYLSSIWYVSTLSALGIFLIIQFAKNTISDLLQLHENLLSILVVYAYFTEIINLYLLNLRAHKKVVLGGILSLVLAILKLGLSIMITLSLRGNIYMGRIWGALIASGVIAIFLSCLILIKGKFILKKEYIAFGLKLSIPLIVHSIGGHILAQSDQQMIFRMVGEEETAVYGYTHTIGSILNMAWLAFNSVWMPYFFEDMKENRQDKIKRRALNYLEVFTLGGIILLLVSPDIVRMTAPESYARGAYFVNIFVVSAFLTFLYAFPACFEVYCKKTIYTSIGTVSAALINIILNIWMIRIWQSTGAAIATMFSYMLLFIFHHIISTYILKANIYTWKFYLKGIIPIAMGFTIAQVTIEWMLLRWLIAAIAGIVLFARIYKRKGLF